MVKGVRNITVMPVTLITLLFSTLLHAAAQQRGDNAVATEIFHPSFKTLQTKVNGNDQFPPIITLGGNEQLTVEFDELASDRRFMRYELVHCNSLWQPDDLLPAEYINGFNEAPIEDYEMSRATLVQYVHYKLTIPNADMRPKLSGNYLLRVFDEAHPDQTLLQVRFSVIEPLVDVTGDVSTRTDIDYNKNHQQLSLNVDSKGLAPSRLMNDIRVVVSQNGRIDNEVILTHPSRIAGTTAIWEHDPRLIFPASNEYRRMETVTTNYPAMHVAEIDFIDPYYFMILETDTPRAGEPYVYDRTQKGRFRVRNADTDQPDTEAEYVIVRFTLDMPELTDGSIFIDGDLTQRSFSPESLMTFNRLTGLYEATLLLKQGSYNYQYLFVKHGSSAGNSGTVEGNDYQTANEYVVKVYYREPGGRYDRLVGATVL